MNPWKNFKSYSRQDIIDLQNRKLAKFVNEQLYPFSPYYREMFDQNGVSPQSIRSLQDLQRIPFTSKADFVERDDQSQQYKKFILQPDAETIKTHWPLQKKMPLLFQKIMKSKLDLDQA